MATLATLAEKIRAETAPEKADIAGVLRRIGEVLDRSIEGSDLREISAPIDLSRIDFKALASEVRGVPHAGAGSRASEGGNPRPAGTHDPGE